MSEPSTNNHEPARYELRISGHLDCEFVVASAQPMALRVLSLA
jgi:hypothetical protein